MTVDTDELHEVYRHSTVTYDITLALELTRGRVDGEIEVMPWAKSCFAAAVPDQLLDSTRGISLLADLVDVDYALGNKPGQAPIDLTDPVLFCVETAADDTSFGHLIDGHHRLYRAWFEGVATLPATILTDTERDQVRTDLTGRTR